MKTDVLIQLKDALQKLLPSGSHAYLYGSQARGDARPDSDWDILVLSSKPQLTFQEEEAFMDHICDLMIETGQAIQLFAYGKQDWHQHHSITPFYKNVEQEGIVLWH